MASKRQHGYYRNFADKLITALRKRRDAESLSQSERELERVELHRLGEIEREPARELKLRRGYRPAASAHKRRARSSYVAGDWIRKKAADDPGIETWLVAGLDASLTRPRDRILFGCPPLPPSCPTADTPDLHIRLAIQGPSFRDLVPPFQPTLSLWTTHFNIALAPHDPPPHFRSAVEAMEATFAAAAALKQSAGRGHGGRGPETPALHYALYWRGAGAFSERAAAEAIALDSLVELGLRDHQVLLFGCGPAAHPHVHILVNRIHPATGLSADVLYYPALLDWAVAYQRRQAARNEDDPPPSAA